MTDSIQILLTAVIITLTFLLLLIGIQIFLIFSQVRKILKKITLMFDDAARVTHALVEPVEEASSFIGGLKKGVALITRLKKIFTSEKS